MFDEELEHFRQELGVLSHIQNLLFEESKNTLVEFLSNISNWSYNLNSRIFEYNLVNFESIKLQARVRSFGKCRNI